MNRTAFKELIQRRFGYPTINVELEDEHYDDAIWLATQKYIRFATDNATQESFYTVMLSGGQQFYDMPEGTISVTSVDDYGRSGGINTLFTIDNFLYNQGAFNFFAMSSGYSMISYHITLGFLDTLRRYSPSKYTYKYHPISNVMEVTPVPDSDKYITLSDGTVYNSPGWVLVRCYMLEGATEPGFTTEKFYERIFERDWIIDYVTALCKITLGRIRDKMAQAASTVGNVGLVLDGSTLLQEGAAEKIALEEKLQNEESYAGFGIMIG